MESVELADISLRAADLMGRVAAGEEFVISEAGRPVARLIPVMSHTWRPWSEVAALFAGSGDPERQGDRGAIRDPVRDPWDRPTDG